MQLIVHSMGKIINAYSSQNVLFLYKIAMSMPIFIVVIGHV